MCIRLFASFPASCLHSEPAGDAPRSSSDVRSALGLVLRLLSVQLVLKTDAALSRVLPNPTSPAGYFPSEAIYLLPFQTQGFGLSSFFPSHTGRSLLLPILPNQQRRAGVRPIRGAWGRAEGLAGLSGLLRCRLTAIDSFPVII